MPAPKWVRNFIQPIAVRDVLHYLIAAATLPSSVDRTADAVARSSSRPASSSRPRASVALTAPS